MAADAGSTGDGVPTLAPDARKVRVLMALCGPLDTAGGPVVWAEQLTRLIDGQRFAVDVVDTGAHSFGAKVARQLLTPLWIGRRFRDAVRRNGPYDVLHTNFTLWDAAVLCRVAYKAGVQVRVVHFHTPHPDMGRLWRGAFFLGLAQRWVLRYATHLLGVSTEAATGQLGPAVVSDARFRVLPAAIDLAPFRQAVDRGGIRASLGIPLDAPVVGHVGRFAPEKNHALIVQAAAEVLRERPDVVFLLVGDGVLRAATEQQVRELGIANHFRFAGERADVAALMKRAMDVLLFPSTSEGLPRVVLEAQAAGLSCVLSDIISQEADIVPSLIQRRSLSDSPQVWAEAVLGAIGDGPPVSREEALRAVEKSPASMEISARLLETIYLECRN